MFSRVSLLVSIVLVVALSGLTSCGKKETEAPAPGDVKRIEPTAVTGEAPESMKKRAQETGTPDAEAKQQKREAKKKQKAEAGETRVKKKAGKNAMRKESLEKAKADAEKAMANLPPMETGPFTNIMLITIDTARAERFSIYGGSRETTPNIDALAKEGVVFENAYAQRNSTWPALATLMTSMYPIQHGVRHNGLRLKDEHLTVAEHLSKSNYVCVASYANATSQNWEGFHFRYPSDVEPVDERATHAAVRWLKDHEGRKFFMWVHYLAPHADYAPADEFNKFVDPAYKGTVDGSKEKVANAMLGRIPFEESDLQHVINLYDGELLYVDNEVKKVIDVLKEQGIYDKTLVIISADHGEELFDHHNYFGHGGSVYDTVLRVPLIMRLPGVIPAGKRETALVQHMNVAPTICDVAGVPIPESFVGKSLMPVFKGETVDYGPSIAELQDEMLIIRTAEYKYILNPMSYKPKKLNEERRNRAGVGTARPGKGGKDIEADPEPAPGEVSPEALIIPMKDQELYRITDDPHEKKDLSAEKPEVIEQLKKQLAEFQKTYGWEFGHEVDKRVQTEVDPEVREELEAMGYVM